MQLGRYELLETIGRGATSTVSRARDTLIGRIVALKTLQPGLGDNNWRERFLAEARIIGQLCHPRIVSLYDVGIEEGSGTPFLVMEYVSGQPLDQVLAGGKTEPQQPYTWGAALARALAYAHRRGVIHGDIKPANILVDEDGRVKLTDFGIARWAAHISHSGGLKGTPAYLSPEQIEGRSAYGRSDLFSLGIVIYELATRRRPFPADSIAAVCAQILKAPVTPPSQINPTLPPALDGVVSRCLAKDPADRYASGEELAADLEAIAREAPAPALKKDIVKPKRAAQRSYAWSVGVLVVALSAWVTRDFGNVFRLPPPPAAVLAAPKAPPDLRPRLELVETTEEMPEPEAAIPASSPNQTRVRASSPKARPMETLPPAAAKVPAKNVEDSPGARPAVALATEPESSRSAAIAQLKIEISAKPSDDTLAVFADHKLLFSTPLNSGTPNDEGSFRALRTLSPGQHHFSITLYKPDKTLRAKKEGLADLRKGAQNLLAIRVTKRSKFFPLRGPGLQVSWPGESATFEPEARTGISAAKPSP